MRDKEGVRAGRHCYRVRIQREEVFEYRDWKTLLQGQNTETGRHYATGLEYRERKSLDIETGRHYATGSEYRERKSLNTETGSLGSCWKLEKARTLELLEGGNLADTDFKPVTPFRTLSSRVWCSAELGSASKLAAARNIWNSGRSETTGERQWLCWARHLGGSGK